MQFGITLPQIIDRPEDTPEAEPYTSGQRASWLCCSDMLKLHVQLAAWALRRISEMRLHTTKNPQISSIFAHHEPKDP